MNFTEDELDRLDRALNYAVASCEDNIRILRDPPHPEWFEAIKANERSIKRYLELQGKIKGYVPKMSVTQYKHLLKLRAIVEEQIVLEKWSRWYCCAHRIPYYRRTTLRLYRLKGELKQLSEMIEEAE